MSSHPFIPDPPTCPRDGRVLGQCEHHAIAAAWSRAIGRFGTRDLEWYATGQTWIPGTDDDLPAGYDIPVPDRAWSNEPR